MNTINLKYMKTIAFPFLVGFITLSFTACQYNEPVEEEVQAEEVEEVVPEPVAKTPQGSVMLIVKAKTSLSEEEFLRIAKERAKQFRELPGLIEKYYIKTNNPNEYGGVYIWDSKESLQAYKESELAKTIGQAYSTTEAPTAELVEIMFELRD